MIPFVIDNERNRMADVLNTLLAETAGKPVDIATAYFTVSGYRLLKDGLHRVGGFRLLLGAEPQSGVDLGLRPDERKVLLARLRGDLEASPFTPAALKLIEDLIAFIRTDRVEVRLYERGFLHAKAYLFHQDAIGPNNRYDRMQPYSELHIPGFTTRSWRPWKDSRLPPTRWRLIARQKRFGTSSNTSSTRVANLDSSESSKLDS